MSTQHTDVAVIGGGVIGICTALALVRQGRSVSVFERSEPGAGASHGNCGTITPSHAPPLAAPGMVLKALRWMTQADAPLLIRPRFDPALWYWLWRFARRCNRDDWQRSLAGRAILLRASAERLAKLIEDESLDCEFERSGHLYVCRSSQVFDRLAADCEVLAAHDVVAEAWDAARTEREEPALRAGVAGGILFPGDAVLRPDRYLAALVKRLLEAGGQIHSGAEIKAIEPGEQRVDLRLADGRRYSASRLVLAAGAWSPELGRQLGLNLPIQPGKGYSITYDRPQMAPRRPLVLKERSVCVTAWASGFRLGSTMEFSGYDSDLRPERLQALVHAAQEYLQQPEGPARREEWFGWRPMTWDDLPIIGPHPRWPAVLLATGHGMMGVGMSAITADLVCALVSGESPPIDPRPYRYERFA
ncbi:NAD(P)/FAD-dependent oxidoreductase [Pseudomarimonas arenosa]|uniref:FAD-dependent oxidoreductase n=1 Tax=Pseudomarimonas arenosa TaxID=2774145 RepID=A0AAW3ZFW0_9GAMM|nr:FAD-dependent oxidoreductase [Pseudomarimonas arenosa]MBD8524768.1 FAD-dependent oxidoreductase [Pseudomarimonas arenosa]